MVGFIWTYLNPANDTRTIESCVRHNCTFINLMSSVVDEGPVAGGYLILSSIIIFDNIQDIEFS